MHADRPTDRQTETRTCTHARIHAVHYRTFVDGYGCVSCGVNTRVLMAKDWGTGTRPRLARLRRRVLADLCAARNGRAWLSGLRAIRINKMKMNGHLLYLRFLVSAARVFGLTAFWIQGCGPPEAWFTTVPRDQTARSLIYSGCALVCAHSDWAVAELASRYPTPWGTFLTRPVDSTGMSIHVVRTGASRQGWNLYLSSFGGTACTTSTCASGSGTGVKGAVMRSPDPRPSNGLEMWRCSMMGRKRTSSSSAWRST